VKLRKETKSPNHNAGRMKTPGNLKRGMALVGTLLVSGIMGSVAAQEAAPKPEKPESPPITACRGKKGPLKPEQEIWFGYRWNSVVGISITGVSKQTVTANVRIPFIFEPADDVIFVSMQFNGIKLQRSWVEPIANKFCEMGKPTVKKSKATEQVIDKFLPRIEKVLFDSKLAKGANFGNRVKAALYHVLAMEEGDFTSQTSEINFTVEGNSLREFVLKVKGGKYDGKTIRLEKGFDCTVEFVLDEVTYVSLPYRIESIYVDEKGGVGVKVGFDPSRKIKGNEIK